MPDVHITKGKWKEENIFFKYFNWNLLKKKQEI